MVLLQLQLALLQFLVLRLVLAGGPLVYLLVLLLINSLLQILDVRDQRLVLLVSVDEQPRYAYGRLSIRRVYLR